MSDEQVIADASAIEYAIGTDGGKLIIGIIDEMARDAREDLWTLPPERIGSDLDFLIRAKGIVAETLKDKIQALIDQGKMLRGQVDH